MDNLRETAHQDFKAGLSPAEIEKKHGSKIKADTVRKWIKRHWTQDTGQDNRTEKQDKTKKTRKTPQKTSVEIDKIILKAVEENTELTEKQKDFCRYFIQNRNATQAYLKAYGGSYAVANVEGPKLLVNPRVKAEIRRLKEIKNAALGDFDGNDIVEIHMRIAFSDITDFVEFENKTVPVTKVNGDPVYTFDPDTGEAQEKTREINIVRLKSASSVDGVLLTEISEGREGVKVKLADKQKSLAFLERWFEMNPMDRHRREYDNRRVVLEETKHGMTVNDGIEAAKDNARAVLEALSGEVRERGV